MYKHILIPTDGSELEPGMVTDTPDGYKKRISRCYREISQGGEGCCHGRRACPAIWCRWNTSTPTRRLCSPTATYRLASFVRDAAAYCRAS